MAIWIILGVLVLILLCLYIFDAHFDMVYQNKEQYDEEIELKHELYIKYNIPVNLEILENGFDSSVYIECLTDWNGFISNKKYGVWYDGNMLKFLCIKPEKYFEINLNNINFYRLSGERKYITNVSGGGGGGSSLGGAIIGGAVAGGAGAIIGSRKKIKDIKTTTTTIDNRKTTLSINYNGEEKYLVFNSAVLAEILSVKCPQKDFEIVKMKSN